MSVYAKDFFFFCTFLFSIYKMTDIMDIYKFAPEHLKITKCLSMQ